MPGSISFEYRFANTAKPAARELDQLPMHLLLMANFSGQREGGALAQRAILKVDIDNMDQIMARIAPRLSLELSGTRINLQFANLDDFTPDAIYRQVGLFAALRQQLADDLAKSAAAPVAQAPAPAASDNPFQALLGGQISQAASQGAGGPLDGLLKQIVAPHIAPTAPNPQHKAVQDAACGLLMNAILHHPEFQALEAAWRGVHFMITQLDLDGELKLFLLDIDKAELAADCAANAADLGQSACYHLLGERWQAAADPVPWSVLIGQYQFDASEADLATLGAMGAIAQRLNAPFVSGAASSIVGCTAFNQQSDPRDWQPDPAQRAGWQALCQSSQARWLGLALPRLLMRLPYGANLDPVSSFAFEEMNGAPDHEALLWGSAGLAAGLVLGQCFQEEGWDMQPGAAMEIDDLPAYTWREQGEAHLQAAAEVALLERANEACWQFGLMTLQSYKNRNAVRLMRISSLAQTALAGRWGE
jgi:type VI secretion system protein ImpC